MNIKDTINNLKLQIQHELTPFYNIVEKIKNDDYETALDELATYMLELSQDDFQNLKTNIELLKKVKEL